MTTPPDTQEGRCGCGHDFADHLPSDEGCWKCECEVYAPDRSPSGGDAEGREHTVASFQDLPHGVYEGANRYSTDDEEVLTLWRDGQTWDLRGRPIGDRTRLIREMQAGVASGEAQIVSCPAPTPPEQTRVDELVEAAEAALGFLLIADHHDDNCHVSDDPHPVGCLCGLDRTRNELADTLAHYEEPTND